MFFEETIATGANIFIIIVAVVIGFVAGLAYLDFRKTKKEEEDNQA